MRTWWSHALATATVEARVQLSNRVWRSVTVAAALLAAVTTVVSHQHLTRRQAETQALTKQRDAAADGGRHLVSGFDRDESLRVVRDPAAMSTLVAGLDVHAPMYWDIGPEGTTAGRESATKPIAGVAGLEFDLEFILRVLIGLLAIVVGSTSMFSARGLRLTKSLASLPVAPSALAVGGLVGGAAAVSVAALAAIASATLVFAFVGHQRVTPTVFQNAAGLWLISTAHGAAMQGLGAIIALVVRNSATGRIAIAATWMFSTFIGLAGVGAAVQAFAPVSSPALLVMERDAMYASANQRISVGAGDLVGPDIGRASTLRQGQLTGTRAKSVDDYWDRELAELRRRLDGRVQSVLDTERKQAMLLSWAAAPLSGLVFRRAAMELSGVGLSAAARWTDSVDIYQAGLNAAVFDHPPRVFMHVPHGTGEGRSIFFRDRRPRPTVSELPVFAAPASSLSIQLRDAASWIGILVLHWLAAWTFAIFIFVTRRAARGDAA